MGEEGVQHGTATWYGKNFHGKKTASGTIYNMNTLTCAVRSRSIPFGTKLKITNVATGKSVIVKVNDRMSIKAKHTIDLSTEAFKVIAPIKQGVVKVKIKVIKH